VTSRLRHARRNVLVADHVSAVWRPLAPSLIAGAFSALAVCMLVRGIGAALLWAMGPEQFAKQYAVEILYRASKFAWLWGVCGVCYGWLHRQHVRTEAGWLSYLLRRFIFATTLAVMGFLLGYLVLVPAFAWSTRVPPLAWVPSLAIPLALFWLVVGAATGIRVYFTKESVFTLILVEGIGFLVLGAAGIGNALVSGYFLGGLCWILGWLIDLPLHYFIHADHASTGFKWGCGIGGLVGFANGLSAILKKQLNR
jgi:hypothetical protein